MGTRCIGQCRYVRTEAGGCCTTTSVWRCRKPMRPASLTYRSATFAHTPRICLEFEASVSTLVSPCACIGSRKYVHIACLERWQESAVATENWSRVCARLRSHRHRARIPAHPNLAPQRGESSALMIARHQSVPAIPLRRWPLPPHFFLSPHFFVCLLMA